MTTLETDMADPDIRVPDELLYDTPAKGMATLTLGGETFVLRRVTHGELRDFSFASADIEDKYKQRIASGAETTREQLTLLFEAQADTFEWLRTVVARLAGKDLPPFEDADATLTGMATMGALIAMWMGSPQVPGG